MPRSEGEHHVVLSPHLDDAVLSRGALISHWVRGGATVSVATVFTAEPARPLSVAADLDRQRYGGRDPRAVRIDEDRRAAGALSFESTYLDLPEVLHRRRPDGSYRCAGIDDIFGQLEADDESVIVDAATAVTGVIEERPPSYLHLPLGIGGHIDHWIVRSAAERAYSKLRIRKPLLAYYEDLPYAFDHLPARDVTHSWAVDDVDIERWIEGIGCYPSQIAIMFEGDWAELFRQWPAAGRSVAPEAFTPSSINGGRPYEAKDSG